MPTTAVTGLTADRMLEIEAASVVDGDIVDGELIFTKHDGSTINAGSVIGPPGPEGPIGSDLEVLAEHIILDIGMPGQIRAGRELIVDDFTNIGLEAPLGLWNFSGDNADYSGNSHNLAAKGTIAYARGIDGIVSACVQFDGNSALYIADTGASDPFRLKTGSFGAWIRTAKRGVYQSIMTKRGTATQVGYWLRINQDNSVGFTVSYDGTNQLEIDSLTEVCDDRWHFVVATYDGIRQNLYIDGILEATQLHGNNGTGLIFGVSQPFNIGGYNADATTAPTDPNYGRIDEAFITSDILPEEKVYNLYCAKISHALDEIPSGISINVRPGTKGASVLPGDFPAVPLRLYNFSAGSLGNEGSNGGVLTMVGTPVSVPGVDGTKGNAYNLFGNQRFTASDAGLPSGTAAISYGCWVKCSNGTAPLLYILTWGTTQGTNDTRLYIVQGNITFATGGSAVTGPFISDGNWHFVVVVQENSPVDGLKRKFYVDGRLVGSATNFTGIALGGANKFVVGSSLTSSGNFIGQVDTVFVCDVALGLNDINKLYTKSLYDHLPSPKNAGDHVHAMSESDLFITFDTLPIESAVTLKAMS